MRHHLGIFCLLVVAATTAGRRADAAMPLADRVPGNAVVYAGWIGTDAMGPKYAKSDMAAFLDNSNLPQMVGQLVGQGWEQATTMGNMPESPALKNAMTAMIRHPLAFYVGPVGSDDIGTPQLPQIALLCDAGADEAAIAKDVKAFVDGQSGAVVMTVDGSIITISSKPLEPMNGLTLAASPRFITATKTLLPDPAVVVYIDGTGLTASLDSSAAKDDKAKDFWPKMREALGITNLKSYAMTGALDDTQWVTSSALIAPGPRTGLLAVIEPHPADPALMARVPANATSVSVYNFDAAKLFDTIGAACATIPDLDENFHKVSGVATLFLGRNFRTHILGSLGTQWIVFTDTDTHRLVVLNHPNDAKMAEDGLVSSTFGIVNFINSQVPGATKNPVVTAVQKKVDGVFLTTAQSQQLNPTLGTKDGILYIGLSPESVTTTIAAPPTVTGTDVTQSPAFIAAVKRLHVPTVTSFDFTDLDRTAPAAYEAFDKTYDQDHDWLPKLEKPKLPPLDVIKPHLSPAVSISWADERGTYTRSVTPFPGAQYLLGDPQRSLVTVAAASAALAPMINQLRDRAMLQMSISNERKLATAIMAYSKDHDGHQPQDLGSLVAGGYLPNPSPRTFVLPTTPATAAPAEKDALADWVNAQAQYDLLWPGKVIPAGSPRLPVLTERGATTDDSARPVAFADGHVDVVAGDRLRKMVHQHETAN